jgi:hypothetical protein
MREGNRLLAALQRRKQLSRVTSKKWYNLDLDRQRGFLV